MFEAIGGVAGCRKLSAAFYGRVAQSRVLKPFFPGKSMKCAIEEFSAFMVEFLDRPGPDTQSRWWVSMRESHARFKIGREERDEWLRLMFETLDDSPIDQHSRAALREFFTQSSAYIAKVPDAGKPIQLAPQWSIQLTLDRAMEAIRASDAEQAIALANQIEPSRRVGLLTEMIGSGNPRILEYACQNCDPKARFNGRTLLNFAAGKGVLPAVEALLKAGADPNSTNAFGHTPLYYAANGSGTPDVIRALLHAGADVNLSSPLHMAARRGNVEVAEVLLDHGANINARDAKGDTPLQRAINCRRPKVAALLSARSGVR